MIFFPTGLLLSAEVNFQVYVPIPRLHDYTLSTHRQCLESTPQIMQSSGVAPEYLLVQ
jgi:hypothetical protein